MDVAASPHPLLRALAEHHVAGSPLERPLFALLSLEEPLVIVETVEPGLLGLRQFPSGVPAVLVDGAAMPPAERLVAVLQPLSQTGFEVCVVGDDAAAPKELQGRLPLAWRHQAGVYRLDSAGRTHGVLFNAKLRKVLARGLPAVGPGDWEALLARREGAERRLASLANEQTDFAARLQARRPVATWAVLTVMAVVFALQALLSRDFSAWSLGSLGALEAARVGQGEWWRLLSCAFLHGGFKHLLFNALALNALGGTVERVLGTARFLLLFFVALLTGSLVSLMRLGEGFSVGASGAVWGLLAAEVVLLWHPTSPLPALVRERARKSVLVNVGLNVMVSFLPHVDWAAHLGGGVAGAAVVALLLPLPADGRTPGWVKGVAGVVVAGLLGAEGWALASSRALRELLAPSAPERVVVAQGAVHSVELPALIAGDEQPLPARSGQPPGTLRGDLWLAPLQVGLTSAPMEPPLDEATLAVEVARLVTQLSTPAAGDTVRTPVQQEQEGEDSVLTAQWTLRNGLVLDIAVRVRPSAWVRADTALWPEALARWGGTSRAVVRSVRWAPTRNMQ